MAEGTKDFLCGEVTDCHRFEHRLDAAFGYRFFCTMKI